MIKSVLWVFLLSACMLVAAPHAFADLQTLAEGAEYGDALLLNGKGKIQYAWALVDSLSPRILAEKQQKLSSVQKGRRIVWTNSREVDVTLAFSGVNIWMERKFRTPTGKDGKNQLRTWRCAYDGEKVNFLRLDGIGKNGLVRPAGDVRQRDILQEDQYDPRYYAGAVQGVPVGAFLRGTAKEGALKDLRITGEEALDGISCQVVEASVANTDVTYKVWIAPGRMYRPVKSEIRNNAGVTVARAQFRQYGGEVWFPSRVTVERSLFIDGRSPVLNDRYILTVADDFQINAGVSDAFFQLKFPKGLKVFDWRTRATFTAQ